MAPREALPGGGAGLRYSSLTIIRVAPLDRRKSAYGRCSLPLARRTTIARGSRCRGRDHIYDISNIRSAFHRITSASALRADLHAAPAGLPLLTHNGLWDSMDSSISRPYNLAHRVLRLRSHFMAEERVQHRLAAIFAADVAGYSRLSGAHK